MKTLITKNSIKNIVANKFRITKKDLIGDISGFPLGVVIRMLEEQEKQRNKPNIKIFQINKWTNFKHGGFSWDETDDGYDFWYKVIEDKKFDIFYRRYPEYKKYD